MSISANPKPAEWSRLAAEGKPKVKKSKQKQAG